MILPFETDLPGPAPPLSEAELERKITGDASCGDIIDEAIFYYKSNVFFRTFEIKVIH